MKQFAVSVTEREHAELVEIPSPGVLAPREIRGKTICTLISPGTEIAYNYQGKTFPSFPGYAAVFEAEEAGSEVSGVAKGDRFFCVGPHRSYQQVEMSAAHRVPAGLAADIAVLARLMGVAMTTLVTTTACPGDKVLVTGAGPVGFLAAQIFTIGGYDVLVAEPDAERRRQVKESGINKVYDRTPFDEPGVAGTVALAAECSGHEQAVMDACRVVRKKGEVVLVGVPWRRNTEIHAQELLSLVFHKYVVLRSGWEWELPLYSADFAPHSIHSGFETALRWLASGRIAVGGLVERTDPRLVQRTYQELLCRKTKGLFVLFDWHTRRD